ncbi:MAG: hypothetical protein ACI3ZK_02310, partial [Candidatus Cryptobacteroides sp.]
MKNYETNRPYGLSMQLGSISLVDRKKLETHLGIQCLSNQILITDKRVVHALRQSKIDGGRSVNKQEFINDLLEISYLSMYVEGKSNDIVFFVKEHETYFNKYVFRLNSSRFNKKEVGIEFVTAGRIDIRHLKIYKKIK